MRKIVTGKQMQLLDKTTSGHFHVPPVVLMEQASLGFVRELFSFAPDIKNVLVVCGTGNNGADGIAIARLLNQKHIRAAVCFLGDCRQPVKTGTDLYELQKQIYREYGYPVWQSEEEDGSYELLIDAVFGIGLSRDVTGFYADRIQWMNRFSCPRVSVDISSGLDADTGRICGKAVLCSHTITFSFGKLGHYLWPGNTVTGQLHIVPMGITRDSFLGREEGMDVLELSDLPSLLPPRSPHSNKGSYGKLLIIAGGPGMAGAAVFSARAAYAAGTGLVRVLTADLNRPVIQSSVPEAVLHTWSQVLCEKEDSAALTAEKDRKALEAEIRWADAVVIGPGLGTSEDSLRLLSAAICAATGEALSDTPFLIDADGLNLLAQQPDLLSLLARSHDPVVMTPHLGEMARLTGLPVSQLAVDLPDMAGRFARENKVCLVLKDFRTVICDPEGRQFLNLSGNDGMATGGSGDVLTGIIGGLLASHMPLPDAAAAGVFLHGLAGDEAVKQTGRRGMTASDLVDGLRCFWAKNHDFL